MLVEVIRGPYKGLKGEVIAEGRKYFLIRLLDDEKGVYVIPKGNVRCINEI